MMMKVVLFDFLYTIYKDVFVNLMIINLWGYSMENTDMESRLYENIENILWSDTFTKAIIIWLMTFPSKWSI